ncbi:EF-hand domain-containing protein [Cyclobacterium jeungdonense]|uniref:EF-hand domain-containing protein n=1 Tax=Cyclobacterium jeungdonense TaxID=708087 RepID=A0ABT8C4D2_9BACT|nr:EF-hand domain-containing protein [Cyclobacterium jeungdonense]MDN3687566.1 EF-hand domain-containing protein [Cyclobacterium jeungdonense]
MKRYNIKKQFGFIILMMFSTSLFAQNLNFSDFDKDDDGWIEKEEFRTVFTANYWDDWNNVDNSYLDDEDFYTFNYALIDTDDDDLLTEEEWTYGYDYYYGDYLKDGYDSFEAYDVDGDGYIEYTEYYDGLYDTDYYVTWDIDKDTYLSQEELAENVFENWDLNDTGLMSRSEFYNFDGFYKDI